MRAVWLFSRNDAIGNLAVVAAAALVWWFKNPWPDLANLIDRSTRGSVTDFLDLRFGDLPLFVFNLADVWITLGVGILIGTQIFFTKAPKKFADNSESL